MKNDGQNRHRGILSSVKGKTSIVDLSVMPTDVQRHECDADEVTAIHGEPWNNRTAAKLPCGITASLTVVNGPDQIGATYPLKRAYNSIGRKRANDVPLRHDAVSSRHAAIFYTEGGEWRILDLQSTNGTVLNGSRVREFAIHDGDHVGITSFLLQIKEGK